MLIERRTMLTGIGAASAAALWPGAARAAAAPDLTANPLRTFILMRGALDDRLVIGFSKGAYVGVVKGVATPLFGFVSATFSRYRQRQDGAYDGLALEQAYFIDLATGEWLHRFANPYTGNVVDVPTGGYPPVMVIFSRDLDMIVPHAPPGQVLRHRVSDIRVEGGDVWLTETTDGTTPGRANSLLQYHETVGLHARLDELTTPGVKHVRSVVSYTAIKSWRNWLNMADYPGESVSSGQGMNGATMADLPASWLAAARVHRPELLADPERALGSF